MKKFLPLLLLAFVSLFIFSCKDDEDSDTYSKMSDITGTFNNANGFSFTQGININSTDVVLVYRKEGNFWQQIPKTYYLDNVTGLPTNRELDYNFIFTSQNVGIETVANFNQSTEISSSEINTYLSNQTFRVVLVPASPAKNAAQPVDYSDYNAVVKYYNLNDSNVKLTKVN